MTSSWVVVPASLGGQALKNNLSASSYSEKVLSSTCQLGVPPWALNPPILRRSVFSEHNLSTIFQTTRQDEYCASFQIADQNSNAAVDAKEIREKDIVEPPSTEFNFSMPPWLVLPERNSTSEQRDYSTKLNALENSIGLYRSRSEVEMVTSTILRAFPYHNEVPQRMLCIDFLSLLVHYMEMNHIALCAAIWHFRTCYRARLTMISLFSEKNFPPLPFGPWSSTIPSEQINHYVNGLRAIYATHIPLKTNNIVLGGEFGAGGRTESDEELQSIKAIAMQASQLKYNEMMADLILSQPHSPSNHNPVYSVLSLDATSLDHVQSLLLSIATNGDWNALAIRTAACLFRLRGLRQPSSEVDVWKRNEARKALYIFAPLAHRLGMYKLKEEIEREGFRLLYSRQYQLVMCLYEGGTYQSFIKKGCLGSCHDICSIEHNIAMPQGMKSLLSDVTARVKRILQEDDTFMDLIASVSVTARVKEPYSIWKKILRLGEKCAKERKDMTIFDVPDALALRVVLRCRKLLQEEDDDTTNDRERALCYYVLQLCKENLPSDGRVNSSHKDYIKNPKPNGYQSIHFRFKMRWRGKDWPFEIQIRSFEMHRVAEYGLAAHWEYKVRSKSSDPSKVFRKPSDDGYLKSVAAWKKNNFLTNNHPRLGNTMSPQDQSRQPYTGTPLIEFHKAPLEWYAREERKREQKERLAPYLEALSTTGSDLAREQVIVFLSLTKNYLKKQGGTIISLPAGARVLDAMREAERKLSHKLKWSDSQTVYKNGVAVSLTERLSSGDILTADTLD